ncbi:SOUL heme-binding family protein [Wolffia australiana]
MGQVLGKIDVETARFEVAQSCEDYEIRRYAPAVVAEVTYDPSAMRGGRDGGFSVLADYIGALGKPKNAGTEKIAMTAPVITAEAAAGATVITTGAGGAVTMRFVLPSKYGKAEDAPAPGDERVVVRDEAGGAFAVVKFGGVATEEVTAEKVEKLRRALERDGCRVTGPHLLARYNPPWTLPPFRTNEILIPVDF